MSKALLLVVALASAQAVRAEEATAPLADTALAPAPTFAQGDLTTEYGRNPMATVAIDAGYGGIAGLLVGFGVALVNQWDHWGRDLTVGAGAGVLVGAAVGAVQAYSASRDRGPIASDGLNRTDKDPVLARPPSVALALHF